MKLERYSFGMGDRFLHQGVAQLQAIVNAKKAGVDVTPVWNKSNREHDIVGTEPASLREEADSAVKALDWKGSYRVDADHINLGNVDRFIHCSDFFTIDVGDAIGQAAPEPDIASFVQRHSRFIGELEIPGAGSFNVTAESLEKVARTFLKAVQQAGVIYRYIETQRDAGFIPEVSMDETENPQTPLEMFFILAMISDEGIRAQTIAPKFTGRFNKGVDYVGDIRQFTQEFNDDLAAIAFAVSEFGLPGNLKLSVHSGSDKFSIYQPIREALQRTGAGIHIKTAGTTWLEELIGLAEAGGEGLTIAKEVYARSLEKMDALCAPYATVIDIDAGQLPSADDVNGWTGEQYARALRHNLADPLYNLHLRQLLHVGYKVAAQMGERYYGALQEFEPSVSRNVTKNLWERHLKPLFID
ncbi:MAG: tagaturonate epimerase family protein [Xanthomonadales bacterium]|nr:tagaturonate epimerase family protein [Xanthomonadales bacterium]